MAQKVIDIRRPYFKKEENTTLPKKKKWIIPILVVALLFFGGTYFKIYRVDVKIWPVTESFSFSEVIDVHAFRADNVVVQSFEEVVQGGRDFEVLGRSLIEEKTEGVINVCQDYSDNTQPIREGTRFVCEKGKLFIGSEAFTIPGRSYADGKTVPGCVEVRVIAAEPGPDHNISSSRFSLPGLQGTALYGRFFGESFTITKEGKKEEVAYLTSEEITKAENILLEELLEKGKVSLNERLGEHFMMDSRGQYNRRVIEKSTPTEGEKSSFRIDMKINVEVIAMKKDSAREFLKSFLPQGYNWHKEEINYDFLRANFEEKSGEVEMSLNAIIYEDINIERLKRDIAGSSFSDTIKLLEEKEGVKEVLMRFYPLGPSYLPRNTNRINIDLLFDKN